MRQDGMPIPSEYRIRWGSGQEHDRRHPPSSGTERSFGLEVLHRGGNPVSSTDAPQVSDAGRYSGGPLSSFFPSYSRTGISAGPTGRGVPCARRTGLAGQPFREKSCPGNIPVVPVAGSLQGTFSSLCRISLSLARPVSYGRSRAGKRKQGKPETGDGCPFLRGGKVHGTSSPEAFFGEKAVRNPLVV